MDSFPTNIDELTALIKKKPDFIPFVRQIEERPERLATLFAIIRQDGGSEKFFCDRVVRKISETAPGLVYPYFETLVGLMRSHNHFIRWGAIISLSHLLTVDDQSRFAAIYEEYFGLIRSDSMVTACNVIQAAGQFVVLHPEADDDMTKRLSQVKDQDYYYHGQVSPECKNLVIGAVIDAFSDYFEFSRNRPVMRDFVFSGNDKHAAFRREKGDQVYARTFRRERNLDAKE